MSSRIGSRRSTSKLNARGFSGRSTFEPLEDRRLLSATPELLADVNPSFTSNAFGFTEVAGITFFSAQSQVNDQELWKTDGTTSGTQQVKDTHPGPSNWRPDWLTNVNGTLFYANGDDLHGQELWTSDGTEAGTVLLSDIAPGSASSSPRYLTNVGGTLYFMANDGTGVQLWKSDGTTEGTVKVSTVGGLGLMNLAGTLLFTGTGGELWRSDGTSAGTVLVKDINPGPGISHKELSRYGAVVGGTLFFGANDGLHGYELWKTDGTTDGTMLVADLRPGASSSSLFELTNVGGTLFFGASDGTATRLWKSDGTGASIVSTDVNPSGMGGSTSASRWFANVNGTLYFSGGASGSDVELWKSDGSSAGTSRVKDIRPGTASASVTGLVNVSGTLYFRANDGTHGTELWRSDGTATGTELALDMRPGSNSPSLAAFAVSNGDLYFRADDGVHGYEPWIVRHMPLTVVGTNLFYKGSTKWNVTNANLPGFSDDNAIAPDKTAYLGVGSTTFANVSSYTNGINGLMIDLAGDHGALTAGDFTFKVGNSNAPATWAPAADPIALTLRAGAGPGGADRVELVWADHAIQGQWLEVTLRGNDAAGGFNTHSGLDTSYTFYYGSAPADSGAGDQMAFAVNSTDELSARHHPHGALDPTNITDINDFNRDGLVNATDQTAVRNSATGLGSWLKILSLGGGPFAPQAAAHSPTAPLAATAEVGIATALAGTKSLGDPSITATGASALTLRVAATDAAMAARAEPGDAVAATAVTVELSSLDDDALLDALAHAIDGR